MLDPRRFVLASFLSLAMMGVGCGGGEVAGTDAGAIDAATSDAARSDGSIDAPPTDTAAADAPAIDAPGATCASNYDCQDGLYCNGIELCGTDGVCVAASRVPCEGGPASGVCDEDVDRCVGMCEALALGLPRFCPPSARCTSAADCDDGDPCTTDSCIPPFGDSCGCQHFPGASACIADTDCANSVFCDGTERCAPSAAGADCRGCAPSTMPTCNPTTQVCDEATRTCMIAGCTTPDVDGDGHRSIACGGDDCDDADASRFPGRMEVCDTGTHDEDCDPISFGFRDGDADSYVDASCCNVSSTGVSTCGNDCDDTSASTHPTQIEICNATDDDCDATVDEGTTVPLYVDADGDGAGNPNCLGQGCLGTPGTSMNDADCDDTNPALRGEGDVECAANGGFRTCYTSGSWGLIGDCPAGQSCRPQANGTGLCF